jgi:hypothetical protein
MLLRPLTLCAILLLAPMAGAQQTPTPPSEPDMTLERMGAIIAALDPEAVQRGAGFEFTIDDIPVLVITDPGADRMRAMVPIRAADGLEPEELMRLMQANFDTALDARYAVAQGRLWGVYIHPLSPLRRDQFISGIAQTVNVARSYGQTYSGGAEVFGGGDSNDIYRQLIERLQELSEEL